MKQSQGQQKKNDKVFVRKKKRTKKKGEEMSRQQKKNWKLAQLPIITHKKPHTNYDNFQVVSKVKRFRVIIVSRTKKNWNVMKFWLFVKKNKKELKFEIIFSNKKKPLKNLQFNENFIRKLQFVLSQWHWKRKNIRIHFGAHQENCK